MDSAGLETRIDTVANVRGKIESSNPRAPILIFGSHYDTVKDAGKYDGMLGIIVPIAAIKALILEVSTNHQAKISVNIKVDFIVNIWDQLLIERFIQGQSLITTKKLGLSKSREQTDLKKVLADDNQIRTLWISMVSKLKP